MPTFRDDLVVQGITHTQLIAEGPTPDVINQQTVPRGSITHTFTSDDVITDPWFESPQAVFYPFVWTPTMPVLAADFFLLPPSPDSGGTGNVYFVAYDQATNGGTFSVYARDSDPPQFLGADLPGAGESYVVMVADGDDPSVAVGRTVDLTGLYLSLQRWGGVPQIVDWSPSADTLGIAIGYGSHAPTEGIALGPLSFVGISTSRLSGGSLGAGSAVSHADSGGTIDIGVTRGHADSGGDVQANNTGAHADSAGITAGDSSHADSRGQVGTSNSAHADSQGLVGAGATSSHADSLGTIADNAFQAHADSAGDVEGAGSHADSAGHVYGGNSHANSGGTAQSDWSHATTGGETFASNGLCKYISASGRYGFGWRPSEWAHGLGGGGGADREQIAMVKVGAVTTDATPAVLPMATEGQVFMTGGAVSSGTAIYPNLPVAGMAGATDNIGASVFHATVIAVDPANSVAASWQVEATALFQAGVLRFVGTPSITQIAVDVGLTWDVSLAVAGDNSGVEVIVTGQAARFITWSCQVTINELYM